MRTLLAVRPETEAELFEGLRRGDPRALDGLMEAFGPRVYRLAYGVTRNAADAEEVVQDVFLTIFRRHDTFEGRSALGSWIYRVTMNAALNKRRGRPATRESSLEAHLPTFTGDGHRAGERSYLLMDWSATPEGELLATETRAILRRALDDLPDAYRAILVLRDVEGLTTEEVADITGESPAAVKSRLHRARTALRERVTHALARGQDA